MKEGMFILGLFLLFSCNKTFKRYYYVSNLKSPIGYDQQTVLFIKGDSLSWYTGTELEIDSCDYEWLSNKEVESLYGEVKFYRRARVVEIDSVFYIKDGVKSKNIISIYKNRVLDF